MTKYFEYIIEIKVPENGVAWGLSITNKKLAQLFQIISVSFCKEMIKVKVLKRPKKSEINEATKRITGYL